MKIKNKALVLLGVLAINPAAWAEEDPIGEISANASVVTAGFLPTLNWNILYPGQSIETIVQADTDNTNGQGTVVPRVPVKVTVRVLAADIELRRRVTDRWGRSGIQVTPLSVGGFLKIGSSASNLHVFEGRQRDVRPERIVFSQNISKGTEISFGGQARFSGSLQHFSGVGNRNVLIFKDGQEPPAHATWNTQTTLGTHIESYLDENGLIDLGPRELIVAFELGQNYDNPQADFQDLIFLLTFEPISD